MAIVKNKEMNWKSYLRKLAESPCKLTEADINEFSGYLLKRDMDDEKRLTIFNNIFSNDNFVFIEFIVSFLTAESPENIKDLHKNIKAIVSDYYRSQIHELIADEEKVIEEEMAVSKRNYSDNSSYHHYYI